MNYIYLVDLEEPLVCVNLIDTNKLTSPAIYHIQTYKTIYPLYIIAPDLLLKDINSINIRFVSPRFQIVVLSNWARNGKAIGIGVPKTRFYTKQEIERFHKIAELEIEFEKVRREVNEIFPSRLSCLFLAENNVDGRTMLKNMFPNKHNFLISEISINHQIQFHKVDSKWIDEYLATGNRSAIENYWNGIPYDKFPQYEYLLEGQIELKRTEDQIYIKNHFDASKYSS